MILYITFILRRWKNMHYFFVYACSICVWCVCVCVCMYKPVYLKARGQFRGLLDCSLPYFMRQVSYWIWCLPIQLVWLVSEAQRSFCLCLSSAGNVGAYGYAWLFIWLLGILTQVLMLARQALYWLSHLPSSLLLFMYNFGLLSLPLEGRAWLTLRCIS